MAEKLPPGAGDLQLELGGETLILRRTLGAMLAFNGYNNRAGIWGVGNRDGLVAHLGNSDIAAAGFVIRQGLGIGPSAVKDLEERIFVEGVSLVNSKLIAWVSTLVAPTVTEVDDDDGADGGGADENP